MGEEIDYHVYDLSDGKAGADHVPDCPGCYIEVLREALRKIAEFITGNATMYDWSDAVSMARIAQEALDNG